MLTSIMIVHRSRIDRLDVPARSIFSSPAIFKREALAVAYYLGCSGTEIIAAQKAVIDDTCLLPSDCDYD